MFEPLFVGVLVTPHPMWNTLPLTSHTGLQRSREAAGKPFSQQKLRQVARLGGTLKMGILWMKKLPWRWLDDPEASMYLYTRWWF